MKPGCVDVMCLACNTIWLRSSVSLYFLFPSMSLERWNTDGSTNSIPCIVCNVLQSHFIRFLPLHSNTYPCLSLAFTLWISSSPLASFPPPISSAADKDVDDYYTRKRHLPDLAARSTLPLHVLKMSQDQVGTQVLSVSVQASKQGHVLRFFYASVSQNKCAIFESPDLNLLESIAGLSLSAHSAVVGGRAFYPSVCE